MTGQPNRQHDGTNQLTHSFAFLQVEDLNLTGGAAEDMEQRRDHRTAPVEHYVMGNYSYKIEPVPGDGNCLFYALARLIIGPFASANERLEGSRRIRAEVTGHIRANRGRFLEQIAFAYGQAFPTRELPEPELALDYYCDHLNRDEFWGGAETLIAVAEMYNVQITILMGEEGGSHDILPEDRAVAGHIFLRLNAVGTGRAHYDPVTERTPLTQGNPGATPRDPQRQQTAKNYNAHTPAASDSHRTSRAGVRMATWNARGCGTNKGQETVDEFLVSLDVGIACIQETHIPSGTVETEHFTWHCSGTQYAPHKRGLAILVRTTERTTWSAFRAISPSLVSGILTVSGERVLVIGCHLPSATDRKYPVVASQLMHTLSSAPRSLPIILLGDFNAHLGKQDLSPSDREHIGKQLHHEVTNENGLLLKEIARLYDLKVINTFARSASVKITWRRGEQQSQLDHILVSGRKGIHFKKLVARWAPDSISDHAAVSSDLVIKPYVMDVARTPTPMRTWNVALLSEPIVREKFGAEVVRLLLEQQSHVAWSELARAFGAAADKLLANPSSPMTPGRRRMRARFFQATWRVKRNPSRNNREAVARALRGRREAEAAHKVASCRRFMETLDTMPPNARVRGVFKYLRGFKKQARPRKARYIPLHEWEAAALGPSEDQPVTLMEETDHFPLTPPPDRTFAETYIQRAARSTAPGVDKVHMEFLLFAPPEVMNYVEQVLQQVWMNNVIPTDWSHTIQVPIPKITRPCHPEDYRRISLCSVGYKMYAAYLLDCLDKYIPDIPPYQAAFLPNRSTDDHCFTVRRVLEERWRQGKHTWVVGLDLAKAFDNISHTALVDCLKDSGVPHHLINRIIAACLFEKTAIRWCQQTTPFRNRSVGVKQGCPISPRLFTLVLHRAISLAAATSQRNTNLDDLRLPILLAYADDILIISQTVEELGDLLGSLIPSLASIGLQVNAGKSSCLLRDPCSRSGIAPSTRSITCASYTFPLVKKLTYLGVQITSDLARVELTRTRVAKGIRAAHALVPFIRANRLPWNVVRRLYLMAVAPVILYGLKTTALTKRNRITLKHTERMLVRMLEGHCERGPGVGSGTGLEAVTSLLRRRTLVRSVVAQRIRFTSHVMRHPGEHILQEARSLRTQKRKVGRPCLTWGDSLREEVGRFLPGTALEDITPLLPDKKWAGEIAESIFDCPDVEDSEDEDPPGQEDN